MLEWSFHPLQINRLLDLSNIWNLGTFPHFKISSESELRVNLSTFQRKTQTAVIYDSGKICSVATWTCLLRNKSEIRAQNPYLDLHGSSIVSTCISTWCIYEIIAVLSRCLICFDTSAAWHGGVRNSLVSHKQTHVSLTRFHTSGSVTMTFHHVGSYGLCLAVRSCLSVCHLSVNRCEITANTSLCHISGYNLRFGAALSLQNTQSLLLLSLSSTLWKQIRGCFYGLDRFNMLHVWSVDQQTNGTLSL